MSDAPTLEEQLAAHLAKFAPAMRCHFCGHQDFDVTTRGTTALNPLYLQGAQWMFGSWAGVTAWGVVTCKHCSRVEFVDLVAAGILRVG